MTPLLKKAQGGMAFGGGKRIPGSGAAFRGTDSKEYFRRNNGQFKISMKKRLAMGQNLVA